MLELATDADIERFLRPYRIDQPGRISLDDFDPDDTDSLPSNFKKEAKSMLKRGIDWMAEQQPILAADDRESLLIIFQGRDAAGKDSMIRHVMSGLNPQGCHVTSFKHPSYEALDHDYLWRYHQSVPGRGEIGIFNRSHYEEVLIVRVHPEILEAQRLPPDRVGGDIWEHRFEDINNFERYLSRNGVHILKFFLNVSPKEQKKRFLERLDSPEKHWKFSQADIDERDFWDDYTAAYEDAISHTAQPHAPWFVVPSDHKWFARLLVASAVVAKLRSLKLSYPEIAPGSRAAFEAARKRLESH
ncbi:MAG: polyphosphate kinase 2 family protein [Pseudomonadales bacterium]|jgi:PPK2 family polyphosphate:nucleotide phosphotransferase